MFKERYRNQIWKSFDVILSVFSYISIALLIQIENISSGKEKSIQHNSKLFRILNKE